MLATPCINRKLRAFMLCIGVAVDVAEVSSKRFLDNTVAVKDIKIDSEEFKNQEGKDIRVSTIEITLMKNK